MDVFTFTVWLRLARLSIGCLLLSGVSLKEQLESLFLRTDSLESLLESGRLPSFVIDSVSLWLAEGRVLPAGAVDIWR